MIRFESLTSLFVSAVMASSATAVAQDSTGAARDLPVALSACAALFDPVGMPSGQDGLDDHDFDFRYLGPHEVEKQPPFIYACYGGGFAVRLNGVTKVPDWVAENVTPELAAGGAERSDDFFVDKSLPPGYSAQLSDYRHSGLDRGHQAPAGDFSGDQQLQNETFVLSNMGPQVGRCFNQGIWRDLEAGVRALLATRKRLIIFTGPIYEGPLTTIDDHKRSRAQEAQKRGAAVSTSTITPASVSVADSQAAAVEPKAAAPSPAIPDAFFKIVLDPSVGRVMAFRFPNKAACKTDYRDPRFRTSVKEIEEETGLAFFPALLPRERTILKSQKTSAWTW